MTDAYLAAETKIPVSFIHAIRVVESNGHADSVRFEPHIFHRDRPLNPLAVGDVEFSHHDHHTGAEILAHADPVELASIPYTPGKKGAASKVRAETNRDAFDRAFALAPERAVRATSWGSFQVLGWALLTLAKSPAEAVGTFYSAPATVSDTLLAIWCRAHPKAVLAAQRGDVAEWVRQYNGSTGEKAAIYTARFTAALTENRIS